MEENRYCSSCKVHVSSDLSNCPLCGKYVLSSGEKIKENKNTYPLYSFKNFQNIKWYNITRGMFWITAIICLIVNLIFPTKPYWYPYVLALLIMVFHVFIEPLKVKVSQYIKELTIMSIVVSLFLIFIDAYNFYTLSTKFGWALVYAGPGIMTASVITSGIICLCSRKYENELLRSVSFLAIFSVVYFLVMFIWFKNLPLWPSLAFMCVSLLAVAVLELFKRNKLIKELQKEFHI